MKILTLVILILFSCNLNAQSGMYIVTLSHSVSDLSECKVIVTDPQGISTSTNITHYGQNIESHYSELNVIFSNVISQGYELMGPLQDTYVDNFPALRRRASWVFRAP